MELTHRFTLPASVEEAWTAFYFPNRIAPCFPGATLSRVDGDNFDGVLKIKLGPMPVEYEGTAKFLERSPENQRIVVEARGEDTRGRGAITATVSMTFTQTESGTDVDVVSDVALTGKAASFGNTVLQEVSDRLVQRLVGCVSGRFATGLGDLPTAEELAMARPAKPAVSRPDDTTEQAALGIPEPAPQETTEQITPPVSEPEPQDTTEATPPAPQPATLVEPDLDVEIPTVEPAEVGAETAPAHHADSPPAPQPEPQDTTEATPPAPQPATLVEPDLDVEIPTVEPAEVGAETAPAHHADSPPAPQPEPQDTTEATPPVSEPATLVEPDLDVEIPTVEPAEVGAETAPAHHADSATAPDTEERPEQAPSAPLDEASEPSSSVATVRLPLLRRYGAPVVGAAVLGAVIGIVRRIRR